MQLTVLLLLCMQPEKLAAAVDENTIGVAAVLGTTYTGAFEDVAALDKLIGETCNW
jgi:glutamate decarboxylase